VLDRLLELAKAARGAGSPAHVDPVTPPIRHNLPVSLTSFVGRELEIGEVHRLLTTGRLVTLTGPGGCGKTRLAIQAAFPLVAEYAAGAWLAELAPVSNPALVPQSVATALGVREEPDKPLVKTLAGHLRSKAMLLLLDNCEHLVKASAKLAEALLHACPQLRILATSREALGIEGEVAFSVPPLSLPEASPNTSFATLMQAEAVRLFADRAATAMPEFAVLPHNIGAVVQICARLDGIPLAIELAAARVKALTIEQVAVRLDDRFSLLTGGSRTALPRHHTLRAMIDWSHNLLAEDERGLLRRLSVFVGGCTLEAAEAVCADPSPQGIQPAAVLDLLAQLVNKSLVIAHREPEQQARYRLLETIREYALERLAQSGELEALRRRHAEYFLAWAEQHERETVTAEMASWYRSLEPEHSNCLHALDWGLESGIEIGLRLVRALWWVWYHLAYFSEGRRWFGHAIGLADPIEYRKERAQLLYVGAFMARAQGDYAPARAWNDECVAIWRELGGGRPLGQALMASARLAIAQGDLATARRQFEESVAISREVGDTYTLALAIANQGIAASIEGDHVTARSYLDESAAICRERGDRVCMTVPLGYSGFVAARQGDYVTAGSFFEEYLQIAREVPLTWDTGWALGGVAAVVAAQGQPASAARLIGAAEAMFENIRVRRDPFEQTDFDATVSAVRDQLGDAAFAAAVAEGRQLTRQQAIEYALSGLEWTG
jgi:non-specific serine/threonine protein kinase